MKLKYSITLLALFAATSLGAAAQAQSYSYTAVTDPSAPSNTTARGINNSGVIVGRNGPNSSFIDIGGVFSNANVPGSVRTVARGINNSGDIVGFYTTPGVSPKAYVQSAGGLSTFSFAGAASTQGTDINDVGSFVGGFAIGGVQRAFQNIGGTASEIIVPGSVFTFATGINNANDVVGYYHMAGGVDQGFVVRNNVVSSFSLPGAAITQPLGINNNGDIVGDYVTTIGGNERAFLKMGDLYTLLKPPPTILPGALFSNATSINDFGVIVGYVGDPNVGTSNSFTATPIVGAPLDIALAGGNADAPILLPISKISSVSGAIGGGVSSQFYSFDWAGGAFSANLALAGADPNISYTFKLCSGSTCGLALNSVKLQNGSWNGTLSNTLAAGAYTIGLIENEPGADPYFTLSFDTAVSSATPEPASWALMILGFGAIGSLLRARRRQAWGTA